ncbi:SURF1 family protein [Methylocapsa palsarum]|uniref:SURF1 family protein n=1 Tax=Methylocapsa palsarum TaxID=1612308 RepID=UPI001FCD67D5|nr:SURF1 family protein [Methylocapsa palsarum]
MTLKKPPSPAARLIWPAVLTAAAASLLISLGVWQLHRLAWKENIIAQIKARATAPATPLPDFTEWARLRPDDYEYRHVLLHGTFENKKEALVFRPSGSSTGVREPGYLVLTPMRLDSGGYVIVNRGFTPAGRSEARTREEGKIEGDTALTGLMRAPESRNFFTPADNPDAGQFFTRDPDVIAAHFGLAGAAPFIVDADASPVPGGWPKGGATELAFPNNHLSYALTWFGLAAGLLGVFLAYAWQIVRPRDAK